jgi:tagatose 6-phosphate kinase
MILCIGPTPAAQRVMVFRKLALDSVNRAVTTLDGAAGKSINVAKVLKALGEAPAAAGFLGGDRGHELRALLEARGIQGEFVEVEARTRQCITVVDESAGTQTELVEESRPVSPSDYEQLFNLIHGLLSPALSSEGGGGAASRAVVMSGTLTPGGPADFYFRCAVLAHEAGAISVVDAQGATLIEALKARPCLVKPNRAELALTVGRELKDEPALAGAMRELHNCGAQRVVVTSGKEATLAFDGSVFWRIVPPQITAANPIGSGDAFTAGLIWRLLRGEDLGEACRWAAAAGAANALSLMPGELEKGDVDRLVAGVGLEPAPF